MKSLLLFLSISLVFISCEKNINFETEEQPTTLVVDGVIEDGIAPRIILTNSLDFFGAISPQIAANSFVHNATVTLSNGSKTVTLKEYSLPISAGYSFYYYSTDASTPASEMLGEQGKKYDLKIIADAKAYTSSTTIPILAKKCDSLWWKNVPNNPDTTLASLMGKFTDPPGLGNYVRYFTKVNSGNFLPGENSAFDDQVLDGKTYSLQIEQGIDRNNPADEKTKGFFQKGDTVTLKFCNIDKATYTFWNTWEFAAQAIGNPFSTPNKVINNINNGGLGSFCGYAVDYKKLIIPK